MINGTGQNKIAMNWTDKIQYRLGAAYKLTDVFTVRMGYYYDPAPAPDATMNLLFPSISYNALTVGMSYQIGNVGIDFVMDFLKGTSRSVQITQDYMLHNPDAVGGTLEVNNFAACIGFSYTFNHKPTYRIYPD